MKTFLTFVFCLSAFFSFCQLPEDLPEKCYAVSFIPEDIWETKECELPVYTGVRNNKSVKRKFERCGNTYFEVVKKPKRAPSASFEWITHTEEILVCKAGSRQSIEVLCEEEVLYFLFEVQDVLIKRGFLKTGERDRNRLDKETKVALKELQLEYGLPVGNLDFRTLDFLGINY